MQKIGDFLERFIKLAQSSDDAKKAVLETLQNNGIRSVQIQNISIRGSVATVKMSPAQKSEVFLRQKKILAELANNPLTKNITTVRW